MAYNFFKMATHLFSKSIGFGFIDRLFAINPTILISLINVKNTLG